MSKADEFKKTGQAIAISGGLVSVRAWALTGKLIILNKLIMFINCELLSKFSGNKCFLKVKFIDYDLQ